MRISANDFVALLKRLDEAGEKAQAAFSSYSKEDQQAALDGLGELRQALYSVLASSEDAAWKGEATE